ncbi:DUF3619 family protein [Chromobacterium sphagni]|uniref:DUF3619 domain-containing protein n=1 Tax=Chromobacterium sphagni TaxID=1903179 RepID=A0A1S1WYU1_9NEIS|nr:DUF3619 family protein [Chromobacterium sphagni]OHX12463.1 hypothetical protein BI347_02325 [Chromobacterium sphagni]OHX21453.1 hypothetical protein BI344_02680 [Chromobacterium sphagni]
MNHANDSQGDHLPARITRILDTPTAEPTHEQLERLKLARVRAMQRFDQRAAENISLQERLALWAQRHTVLIKRGGAALGFAVVTGAGLMLLDGLLVESEAVDAAVLSQDLPLNSLLEPNFSRGLHE